MRIPLWLMATTALLGLPLAAPAASPSAFLTAPAEPGAVTVKAVGDGRADDSAALQAAIDQAGSSKTGEGIVFLPSGRYRISRTINVWPGVRLFGVGKTRPVILLGANTPGFDKGLGTMVIFAGFNPARPLFPGRPFKVPVPPQGSVPATDKIADANSGTFYSAMSNVDWEIGPGNPAATVIRFHTAQHAYLSHMDFQLGSGLAGLYQVGNEAEDLHFHGGRYGILAEKTSPAWQFTLIDSSFDGQRDAAIREHEAGLTLVNVAIRNTPVGIDIDQGYGDWLWGKDVRFENVSKAGVIISNENNAYTQIGFDNALAKATPVFARFRDSGKTVAGPGAAYRVSEFNYGMVVPGLGQTGHYATNMQAKPIKALPAPRDRAVRLLPPVGQWFNVRDAGAKGDNKTDDTAAIQQAIDAHRVVYVPAGRYLVTDTLKLRPDSVLIGLHPSLTQIILPDATPAFAGIGAPRALIESAKGGDAIVSGLGLNTNGINPRATALLWKAGANSLVQDVKIQNGHGTNLADGTRVDPYNANHSGDPDPARRWDAQYPSIWVTDGGGGTFTDVWSPDTYATAGFKVSDTDTPGHVYELSNEHHVRSEIVLDNVRNWEFLAPQTEEETGESQDTISLDVRNSHNILFANYHAYRVTRSVKPAATAVRLINSSDIRFRNVHVNAESGFSFCDKSGCGTYLRASKYPYENAITDVSRGLEVREREFAVLDVPGTPPLPAQGSAVQTLHSGFYSIAGAAVDAHGKLYFVDRKFQTIYGWSKDEGLTIERDDTLDPVNLAFDKSGTLIVLSSDGAAGTVYAFKPGSANSKAEIIRPTPVKERRDTLVALPGNVWNNGEFRDQLDLGTYRFTTLAEMFARDIGAPKAEEYVSPDGSLVLPAFPAHEQGPPNFLGWRFSDTLDTYGFVTAKSGERVFLSNGSEDKTYSGVVGPGGSVTDLKPFANRGGESVAVGPDGRVYVANGQIFVYAADGSEAGRIDVPERPLQLVFGGPNGRTLFILAHHALFAVEI
ncbi:MAG TPA: glycosyl hydrolase family 28-related protein [Sphingomonas sp.]|uniref:glycosyl hydrolase family 28-related protein n=1 Tax=Sphingomonas sp. TaxID=28214 RepID=UPI002CBBE995|nr:glycosyl hydrolase family 28-related protein [Sphingomonas sp.]HMI20389.1 glycosyl hydrolase family 28-related protein [Sphingomonas sp.]